jgi:hypothetical protein
MPCSRGASRGGGEFGNFLDQVLGIEAIADPRIDEGINAFKLFKCNSVAPGPNGTSSRAACSSTPGTGSISERSPIMTCLRCAPSLAVREYQCGLLEGATVSGRRAHPMQSPPRRERGACACDRTLKS